jgi:[acyl-carrier-protein] S-malonyltransferase
MNKTAFLFPGQGAQYVGMGKELYENFPVVRDFFDSLDLDFDIKKLCFEGPEDTLKQTKFTQPCLLAVEIAFYKLLTEFEIRADICAGLSLGEYAALAYSGAIDEKQAVKLVQERGKIMEEAVPAGVGGMAAILALDEAILKDICNETSQMGLGIVEIANYNCPGQLVIGGHKAAVEKASELAKEKGAKAILLNVSGPFHTSLLKDAGAKLRKELEQIEIKAPNLPVIFNTKGNYQENDQIIDLLERQCSGVYFEKTIRLMLDSGVSTFIEVGPSKTLSGFVKKIDRKANIYNLEDMASLAEIKSRMSEVNA